MDYSMFQLIVIQLFGNSLLALIGVGIIFGLSGIVGRMSYMLLFSLLTLYFVVFGVAFFGIAVYLPLFLIAVVYFFISLNKFLTRE